MATRRGGRRIARRKAEHARRPLAVVCRIGLLDRWPRGRRPAIADSVSAAAFLSRSGGRCLPQLLHGLRRPDRELYGQQHAEWLVPKPLLATPNRSAIQLSSGGEGGKARMRVGACNGQDEGG